MKKTVSIILIISLLLCTSGCSLAENIKVNLIDTLKSRGIIPLSDEEIIEMAKETVKFGFSSAMDEDIIEFTLTKDDLENWENPYGEYAAYYFRDKLEDDDKLVYKALEYAMVNSYKRTYVDTRIDVSMKTLDLIPAYLSYDTPFFEQNRDCFTYTKVGFYDYKYSEERTVPVAMYSKVLSVDNFEENLWNKKMEALEKAKEIIKTFDTTKSEAELAEEIYRYVALNTEYEKYINENGYNTVDGQSFLYDAIVEKKSQCDGFTNALSLLFNLAGFESIEKECPGHTYNCVKIGDKWYNCDATASSAIPSQSKTMHSGVYFAFCDTLQDQHPTYGDQYPKCEESLYMNPDAILKDYSEEDLDEAIRKGFENHNDEWALVVVDIYDENMTQRVMQNAANQLHTTIVAYKIRAIEGNFALIFSESSLWEDNMAFSA